MRFLPEPTLSHDRPRRIGVLLINLGTPDAPTSAAVRDYLAEFLSDPRVVEIPRAVWMPLLHGVILRLRPGQSARKYATIWGKDGSPLLVHSLRQKTLLQGYLGQRMKELGLPSDRAQIELGMRYGRPSIGDAMAKLKDAGCDRLLVVPLYPQYAASTTASALDAVFSAASRMRTMPALRVVAPYHDDAGYIRALAQSINDYWVKNGRPNKLVLSFHGVPRRSLDLGDPYHCHCRKTARLVADELGLTREQYAVSFQSRFGRAEWLKPYTVTVLREFGRQKLKRVDVFCPGFVADCLETLEEIAIEGKNEFVGAGGGEMRYIPALNDHPAWYQAMGDIAWAQLTGWLSAPCSAAERALQVDRARQLGAAR